MTRIQEQNPFFIYGGDDMFLIKTILPFCLLFLLLLPCAEAADAYADESVLPLVLEHRVERVGPRIDTGELDICLSHASLHLRSNIMDYRKLVGRLNSHDSEQTLSHHYGKTNYAMFIIKSNKQC